jgi:hypothetical protein
MRPSDQSGSPPPAQPPHFVGLDFQNSGIHSFAQLSVSSAVRELNLAHNAIQDFSSLPEFPSLRELNLDFNPIASFKGAAPLPALRSISYRSTPLTGRSHNALMCLIVFGSQIMTINDAPVQSAMRARADANRELAADRLRAGDLVRSVTPLTFLAAGTEKKRCAGASAARFSSEFLSGKQPLAGRSLDRFHSKLTQLRDRFNYGSTVKILDFHPEVEEFDSDASFEGTKLRKVVLPRHMVFDDGFPPGEEAKSRHDSWTSGYSESESESTSYTSS